MGEKRMLQRGVKGPRSHGATEDTRPRGHGWAPLQKRKLYLSLGILVGGIAVVMFTLLGMLAYRNSVSERELLLQNALLQGYWIARSLEISHRVATHDHAVIMRNIIHDIQHASSVQHVVILDERKQVLMASNPLIEGTPWGQPFDDPPEHGTVVHRDHTMIDVVFPASFVGSSLGPHTHPEGQDLFQHARWILLRLDVTEAYAHYRDMVTQKVMLVILVILFGIAALGFVSIVQNTPSPMPPSRTLNTSSTTSRALCRAPCSGSSRPIRNNLASTKSSVRSLCSFWISSSTPR